MRRGRPRDSTNRYNMAAAILAFLEGSKPGFYSYREIADGIEEPKSTVCDAMELVFRYSLGGPVRYFPGKGWYARIHEADVLRLLEDHPMREDVRVARNEPERWGDDPVEEAAWFLGNVQGRPVKDLSRLPQDVGAALYALQGGGSPIESVNRMRLDTGDYDVFKSMRMARRPCWYGDHDRCEDRKRCRCACHARDDRKVGRDPLRLPLLEPGFSRLRAR